MTFESVLRLAATAWMVVVAYQDVRKREISNWLTVLPLVIAVVYRVMTAAVALVSSGTWMPPVADGCVVLLAFVAIMLSDRWLTFIPAALTTGMLAWVAGTPTSYLTVIAWFLMLGAAKAGILGEADAKMVMALLAFFPAPALAVCLLGACGLVSFAVLIRKMGLATPILLRLVVRDALRGQFPARTEDAGVAVIPLAPVLAAGALVYLWILPLLGVVA
jgi:hypothetical protein